MTDEENASLTAGQLAGIIPGIMRDLADLCQVCTRQVADPYLVRVAVDVGNLIRVQVKSTRRTRVRSVRSVTGAYWFFTARVAGRRSYEGDAFDLLALVALDIRIIAYLPMSFNPKSTVCISSPDSDKGKQFADFPFSKAVADLGL